MKKTGIKKITKKLVFPILMAVTMLAGFSAQAQFLTNGIASITCDRADPSGVNPILNVGTKINISILLHGYYQKTQRPGIPSADYPELQMVVNGEPAYAPMTRISTRLMQSRPRTELIFTYTVRSGDMTSPLKIYGSSGVGTTAGNGFQFLWNGWKIAQVANSDVEAKWIYDYSDNLSTDEFDLDLSDANVTIQTLFFDTVNNSVEVAATESVTWRVYSHTAIEANSLVTFYVWPADYNIVELGGIVTTNQPYLVTMTPGSTYVDFPVRGLVKGDTEIFLQGKTDYNNGETNYLYNNFIPSPVAIRVIDPPAPTVKVVMDANSSQSATLDEINPPNTGRFHVELSETYTNDITVLVDASYFSGNPQNSVIMVPDPVPLLIKVNELSSGTGSFNMPDGVAESQIVGVLLTPAVQGITASNKYTRVIQGTVYVNNVAPVVTLPQLPANSTFELTSGVNSSFEFDVDDVTADLTNNMTNKWNFGDGTPIMINVGPSGQIYHRYTATGTYQATVQAIDKDGAASPVVQFTVEVIPPQPQPTVSVIPTSFNYDETKDLGTGSFYIKLSEAFNEAADFYVEVDPVDQTNIVLSYAGPYTISQGTNRSQNVQFSVIDGTLGSGLSGIVLRPVVSNVNAAAKFIDVRDTRIYLKNINPVITSPWASDPALPPDPTYYYDQIPYGVPFDFKQRIDDVAADLASMEATWDFGDGDILTFTGSDRYISHTYTSFGDHFVTVLATDKDGGSSTLIEFKVTVVEPPPPAMVEILVPVATIRESDADGVHKIGVELNEQFGENVVVNLAVDPIGNIGLRPTQVTFSPGQTHKDVDILVYDGDEDSAYPGVYIIPTVIGTANAVSHYLVESSAVRVVNVNPVIRTPATNAFFEVAQGETVRFDWDVDDVDDDLDNTMKIEWRWGDGSSTFSTTGQGSEFHIYTELGTKNGILIVTDKDDGEARRYFTVVVSQAKMVIVTPIGPNLQASYYGMDGLGNGRIKSQEANAASSDFRNLTYFFKYSPVVNSASLEAIPYPKSVSGKLMDSFFYVWVGADQGLPESKLNPSTTTPVTAITLPALQSSTAADGSTTLSAESIRDINAVFSREWRLLDNMGDINADGIPDKIAQQYGLPDLADSAGGDDGLPNHLVDMNDYNGDEDYLPGITSGGGILINLPGLTNVYAAVGGPFTAILEIRGEHLGLNNLTYGSELDGPRDEPGGTTIIQGGTSPTMWDTDGDTFPDGWEYYFWNEASRAVNPMTGEYYNPTNVAVGIFMESKDIIYEFNPLLPAYGFDRDLDNDGLMDVEELTMGTNPVHWDTDGDGMCDGWEVMYGLNPIDPRDATDFRMNNTDGDFMAGAFVERQWVTVVGNQTTNNFLAVDAAIGDSDIKVNTWYNYGGTNAPLAMGGAVMLEAGFAITDIAPAPVEVLILHYQVRDEFAFDPRTGWRIQIGKPSPNTMPFTSLDEYLLMKFMSATGAKGIGASIPATSAAWHAASTDPKTPDSDATYVNGALSIWDSMPDGWELYVSTDPEDPNPIDPVMAISAWNPYDFDDDIDRDGLWEIREFASRESSAFYGNPGQYSSLVGTEITILPSEQDIYWSNKIWPTNPWNADTDFDSVGDSGEQAFIYGNNSTGGAGGGLNPCTVDTDGDALPDSWEVQFFGTPSANNGTIIPAPALPGQTNVVADLVITNGMDGTVVDYAEDWDNDGLFNYQEYWVQAVRHFRYDFPVNGIGPITGNPPLPMNQPTAHSFFYLLTNIWDSAYSPVFPLYIMAPVNGVMHTSTDPRMADTDYDTMDDFYELYHGLNPVLGETLFIEGDRVMMAYPIPGGYLIWYNMNDFGFGLPMDFVSYPWLAGLPEADVDSDGLLNFEEQILANTSAPMHYNTDPSPLWLTDNYTLFTEFGIMEPTTSMTYNHYFFDGMYYWPTPLPTLFMFTHEQNEGYDTDNDGVSDKDELIQEPNPLADPRDHDNPIRRQALWFAGTNSAARTIIPYRHDDIWSMHSFTVELWVRPDEVNRHQVIINRSIAYTASDLNDEDGRVRKNFLIGIEADGRVYGKFDNAGSEAHDEHTAIVKVHGPTLAANKWVHLALRMDGLAGKLSILVNGEVFETVETTLIPANGAVYNNEEEDLNVMYVGSIAIGASDDVAGSDVRYMDWDNLSEFYKGYVDEVRIWDGARSLAAINADINARYLRKDIEDNRAEVAESLFNGGSRVIGVSPQLPPELLYHYNFDNLFSVAAADTNDLVKIPRGFDHTAVLTNQPVLVNGALGMRFGKLYSTHYNDRRYNSIIENGVVHLPAFGGFAFNIEQILEALQSDTVPDSVFWAETMTGSSPASNIFPNDNNPYGVEWRVTAPGFAGMNYASDLMPLGGAYPKMVENLWDDFGPSAPWIETGTDSNSDGLPDWWSSNVVTIITSVTNVHDVGGWYDLYPDGSGMTNGQKYQRDIAKGVTPSKLDGIGGLIQIADMDGDGMPDWWEDIFNINKMDAIGNDGGNGDLDIDGLSNRAEYNISEVYGFDYLSPRLYKTDVDQPFSDYFNKEGELTFGFMFTDHDFMEAYWEDIFDPSYVNSYVYDPGEDNDEDGWSNWAEARFSSAKRNVDPDSIMSQLPGLESINEYPIPVIESLLRYNGLQSSGDLVINAYGSPEMDGIPDATYAFAYDADGISQSDKTYALGGWTSKEYHLTLTPGSIAPGTISITLTDQWNGLILDTAYDVDGVLYNTFFGGGFMPMGTIDYDTGKIVIDMTVYTADTRLIDMANTTPLADMPRDSYILVGASTIEVSYTVNLNNTWPKALYLGKSDTGWIREGLNYFFAFIDVDASGTWDAGEPCGIPEQPATDIGWDSNQMKIELTDYRTGYLRLDLTTGMRSEDVLLDGGGTGTGGGGVAVDATSIQRVRVLRTKTPGLAEARIVLDRDIQMDRTYLHEGDLFEQGDLALDWGMTDNGASEYTQAAVYEVYFGGDVTSTNNSVLMTTFTNAFDSLATWQSKLADGIKPIHGGYVYSSRPVFHWTMPDNYPAFAIEIKKGSPSGTTVYYSGALKAPSRHVETGEYIWEAPIHAGNVLESGETFSINTVYAWRVIPLDAKFYQPATAAWSDWKMFRLDVNRPMESSGYAMIEAVVKYLGPANDDLRDLVKVSAYTTRDFTGVPASQYTLLDSEIGSLTDMSTTNVNAVMRGLTPSQFNGWYYIMAYIDYNKNNQRDAWESWGYANYYGKNVLVDDKEMGADSIYKNLFGGRVAPYVALPVETEMSTHIPRVIIQIEDNDTDQDWFPDAWEYEMNPGDDFLEPIGPSDLWPQTFGNTEVNPPLAISSWPGTVALLAFGSTDSDGDGIDDIKELVLGTDASVAEPPIVAENLLLGLAPDDKLDFSLTGLAMSSGGAEVKWEVNVDKGDTTLSQGMLNLMSGSADGSVSYYVDFTTSLSTPNWITVENGTVTLDGCKTLVEEIKTSEVVNSFKGFFKVRLGK